MNNTDVNMVQTEWWCLELPPEWQASCEDDCVTIEDQDGVGAIDISAMCKEGSDVELADLGEFCADLLEAGHKPAVLTVGNGNGWYFAYVDGEDWWREWYLIVGPVVVYITYNTALENRDMDTAAVDEILSTLVIAP